MAVFAIALNMENDEIHRRIEDSYPRNHQFSSTLFLVQDDTIPETVARNVGIKGDNRITDTGGVVFRLEGSYAGFTSRALWDWLRLVEEQE